MIHVMHNGKLLEQCDYSSMEETPTVGHRYVHNNVEYDIDAVIVDTRKGYCELIVKEHRVQKPYIIHSKKEYPAG